MASLYVDEVLGLQDSSGTIVLLQVTGSAPGADRVRVEVDYGGQQLVRDPVQVDDGGWTASFQAGSDFPAGDIGCDAGIRLMVSGPDVASKSEEAYVRCVPSRICPHFTKLTLLASRTGVCDMNQMRRVTIVVGIVPRDAVTRGEVRVRGEEVEGEFSAIIQWPPNTEEATAVVVVPAGRRYSARVYTTSPYGCAGPSTTFTAPSCECPVTDVGEPVLLADGRVEASATIFVAAGSTASAVLRLEPDPPGPPIHLDEKTGQAGTFELAGATPGPVPAGSYWAVADVTEPLLCGAGRAGPLTIVAGGGPPDGGGEDPNGGGEDPNAGGENPNGGGDPDGGGDPNGGSEPAPSRPQAPAIPWCLLLLLLGGFVAGLGGIIFAAALCAAPHIGAIVGWLLALEIILPGSASSAATILLVLVLVSIVVGLLLMFVGTVLIFIWLFTCGLCRSNCGLVVGLLWALGLLMAVEFLLVLAASGQYLCMVGWFISGLDLAIINLVVLYVGAASGCFAWPPFIPGWLRLRIPASMRRHCP